MRKYRLQLLISLLICCSSFNFLFAQTASNNGYIGSIQFDPETDDPSFKICFEYPDDIPQYYTVGTSYEGGLKSIKAFFGREYILQENHADQNGYLTIRFIVNCKGQTGWYRFLETDFNFSETHFKPAFKNQILSIVKKLNQWHPGILNGKPCDSYKFLTFKISHGKIEEILP